MRLTGHLDRCDTEGLGGWVVDLDNPQTAIELQFYLGDRHLGSGRANQFRRDLVDARISDGHCAFRFIFDEKLDIEAVQQIEVRIDVSAHKFTYFRRDPFLLVPSGASNAEGRLKSKRYEQCILHIGTEKTGSTSVQAMLANNRKVLSTAGFFFPESLCQTKEKDDGNHCHIAAMAMRDDAFDSDLRGQWGITDFESLEKYRVIQAQLFDKDIIENSGDCTRLLLSNEHCHSRLLTISEVASVKALLEPYCDEFKIVVYLRPQFELALSQYGMMVLNGYYDIEALPPLPYPADYSKRRYTNQLYFDYEQLLNRWGAVFGYEALDPRLYNSGGSARKNPTVDFLDILGLSEGELLYPGRENTNISGPAQEFLIKLYREFSARGLSPTDRWANPIRATMRKLHPGSGARPARAQVQAFQQGFDKSNEAVRSRWFADRERLFDEDYAHYPETESSALDDKITFGLFADVMSATMKLT
jgi:hypothetical protein